MPIDELYGESTNAFLSTSNQVNVPVPRNDPSTSLGSILRAGGRGVAQGGLSLAGAASDLVSGASQAYVDPSMMLGAAVNPEVGAMIDKQTNEAVSKAKGGTLLESRLGTAAYDLADTFKPNPTDSTRADQIVQGAVSGLTQILPAAIIGGPAAAAAVGGTSIGLGRAEELKREGVDVATRSKVGAVSGGMGAVGAVLPVAGTGLASTLGLVAVGGPGMAIAQGAAEKAILKNADYSHLSDQIDPLDPVNLAAATFMAGAFGGVHMVGQKVAASRSAQPAPPAAAVVDLSAMDVGARRGLRYNDPAIDSYAQQAAQREGVPPELMLALKNAGEKSGSTAVSPKGAAGVSQMMPENQRKYGVTDPTDPVQALDGMAKYLRDTMKQYNGDLQAVIADYNGGPTQARAVLRGEKPPAAETRAYMDRVNSWMNDHAINELKFNPTLDQVDAALSAHGRRMVDADNPFQAGDVADMGMHQDLVEYAARQMDAGNFPDITRYVSESDAMRAQSLEGMIAEATGAHTELTAKAADIADPGMVKQMRAELDTLQARMPGDADVDAMTRQLQQQGMKFKKAQTEAQKQIDSQRTDYEARVSRLQGQIDQNARAQEAAKALPDSANRIADLQRQRDAIDLPPQRRTPIAEFVQRMSRSFNEETSARPAPRRVQPQTERRIIPENIPDAAPARAESISPVETNLRQSAMESPDTPVHLDANAGEFNGTLADAMRLIDEEHANTLADSKLLDVAANCFISLGA